MSPVATDKALHAEKLSLLPAMVNEHGQICNPSLQYWWSLHIQFNAFIEPHHHFTVVYKYLTYE